VKDTRLTVDAILNNAECGAEEIATELFEGVTVEQVRRILSFAAEHPPSVEDELYAIILDFVRQECGYGEGPDDFNSWGLYERAFIALVKAGYVEIDHDSKGRMIGRLTGQGQTFEAWMSFSEQLGKPPR
jgi:hypothetical protein